MLSRSFSSALVLMAVLSLAYVTLSRSAVSVCVSARHTSKGDVMLRVRNDALALTTTVAGISPL